MEESKEKATESSPEDIKKKESEEKEAARVKAKKEHRKHIEARLKECNYKESDGNYSFEFKTHLFSFRLPNLLEKAKIKSILSQVAYDPGGGIFSATQEIQGSGDLDLICSTQLLTHMSVLLEPESKDFDLTALTDIEEFDLGYLILISEREFIDRKKKVSIEGQ